ncbi:hypothetical protein AB6E89_17380 [Vibrio breoganii]
MSKFLVGLLAGLVSMPVVVSASSIDIYQEQINQVRERQGYVYVESGDLNNGGGQNANSGKVSSAETAESANTANRATLADTATTVATSERNAIINSARQGNASSANYAARAGSAISVETAERNAIINAARSGMGVSAKDVCDIMSSAVDVSSGSYWRTTYRWNNDRCEAAHTYRSASSCGQRC